MSAHEAMIGARAAVLHEISEKVSADCAQLEELINSTQPHTSQQINLLTNQVDTGTRLYHFVAGDSTWPVSNFILGRPLSGF